MITDKERYERIHFLLGDAVGRKYDAVKADLAALGLAVRRRTATSTRAPDTVIAVTPTGRVPAHATISSRARVWPRRGRRCLQAEAVVERSGPPEDEAEMPTRRAIRDRTGAAVARVLIVSAVLSLLLTACDRQRTIPGGRIYHRSCASLRAEPSV